MKLHDLAGVFPNGEPIVVEAVVLPAGYSGTLFATRPRRGTIALWATEELARERAGKTGQWTKLRVTAEYEGEPKPQPPKKQKPKKPKLEPIREFAGHDCHRVHRRYAQFARCRWPRPHNVKHIFGEGRFGVYLEPDEHYPDYDGRRGAAAVWPDIHLEETEAEARDLHTRLKDRYAGGLRRSYVFSLPADLRDAYFEPRTIKGNRARYEPPTN